MDYQDDIKRSIAFIEDHLKEDLTPDKVSAQAGYSLYHFCRVFQAVMGIPVMEYIRKRRLAAASGELTRGLRIIDVAVEFGYETQSGFTKAFRKEFGVCPTRLKDGMSRTDPTKPHTSATRKIGGLQMNPVIVNKSSFKVAGYSIETNVATGSYTGDIAAFWNHYDTDGWEEKLYHQLRPRKHGEIGLCIPQSKESGSLRYLLGVIAEDDQNLTDDMEMIEVPEATYAVFTSPPADMTSGDPDALSRAVRETWRAIFEDWFKDSGYAYDESKLDFEFYDERCHYRSDAVMEIYVPVVKIP